MTSISFGHRSATATILIRIFFVGILSALLGLGPVNADQQKGCSFIGSWFGFDAEGAMYWTSTASGQNSSEGTYMLEVPSFEATLGSAFPEADTATIGKGIWKRLDGHTFAGTLISIIVDADGQTVWVAKINALDTLSADCNSMWVEVSLEIFMPWQNPYTEESYFLPVQLDGHPGYRVTFE